MTSTKKMNSSSNSSEFKYIPPEVLTQILAKLPAQTLLRFRCVCKSWCSSIDHPDFVSMHLQLCKNNNNQYNSGKLLSIRCSRSIEYDGCLMTLCKVNTLGNICHVFRSSQTYHFKGRCNSLVLMCRFRYLKYDGIIICNPSIRKSLLLPPCPLPCRVYKSTFVLGFAPGIKDFKVIAISFTRTRTVRHTEMRVAVFTLGDQQWNVRNNGLNMDCSTFGRVFNSLYPPPNACYSNGAAHWLGYDPYGDSNNQMGGKPTHLVSLDFDTEIFNFLELPIALDETETERPRFVFLLGESLAIFSICYVRSEIWVLKQESGKREWSQWFLGPSSVDGYDFFCQIGSRARLLYYEGDGGYFVYGNKSYNIATGEVRKFGKFVSYDVELELEMYSESLLLCKGYGAKYMASSSS